MGLWGVGRDPRYREIPYIYFKLRVNAEAARGLGAYLCDIGPCACGGWEPIPPVHIYIYIDVVDTHTF